ncbi:arabinan endo-1,5-alpha-L-arabinosidase [Micromonospora sp. STR1s_6]|uniref:Arabinan endo-1,5-alpha-L-arabinosidase n=1 Tax=Micromonospora tarensis TaxID=2806100 RepID=A0ABS1YLK2_9ACTN|nr:arabinan endo-1,5-alpha-L-arabinosidase [Micromonospora tarensis]
MSRTLGARRRGRWKNLLVLAVCTVTAAIGTVPISIPAAAATMDAKQQWQLVPVGGNEPRPAPAAPLAPYPAPGRVTGDIGVHDPTVVKRPTGGYLMVHTGNNVAIKTSPDRTNWRNAGAAFPGGAPWTLPYTNGGSNLWAGDISFHNGQYWLYYSASSFGSNRSAIFLATSPTGASGSWTNRGLVIESRTSDNFNAIDPNLVVDDQGRWWLSFGSFWSGLKLVQVNPSNGLRLDGTIRSIAGRGGGAIEAPYIFKHGSYYYLWVSWDMCCRGASSTYRVMVGRSTSITGPYRDRSGRDMNAGGGTEVLAGHDNVRGPGHQAVIGDTDGDVLIYHYYNASNGAALLGINRIGYDSAGWPFVF